MTAAKKQPTRIPMGGVDKCLLCRWQGRPDEPHGCPRYMDSAAKLPGGTWHEKYAPSAGKLYGAAVAYLLKAGWRRMEFGSGWWWREGFEEATVGDALDQQLEADGIDFRTALIGEPEEFCG